MKSSCSANPASAITLILSLALAPCVFAQTQPAQNDSGAPVQAETQDQLAPVVVTGSLIRESGLVNFNQVQSISNQDIANNADVTVADFVRDLPVNSASSWGDDFAYGATGGAGIAIRGLSEKYTLVLVDGIRVTPYGFPSNGTDTFVDLNTIPLNDVDHIEIVKTGDVSQYGSDAIAGVVNVITRKDYQGLDVNAGYGDATQGGEATRKLGLIGGIGNLNDNRFNLTASASFFQQNGFTLAGRDNTSGQDYTNKPYGALTTGADYWEPAGVGGGGSAVAPCPAGSSAVDAGLLLSGSGTGSACAVRTADGLSLHPYEERIGGKIHGIFRISDSTEAFVDLWDSRNTTINREGYNGVNDSTTDYAYNPLTGGIGQVPNIVSASNSYNPYGTATPLTYTFLGAPDVVTVTSNFWRALAGLDGKLGSGEDAWNWNATISHSQSNVDNSESGLESVAGLANVLTGGFDFADPGTTPGGLGGLYVPDSDEAISKLDSVDVSASTPDLLRLPAGALGIGAGAQFLHESDYVIDYALQSSALAVPFYLQAIDGQRDVAAVYYQVNVPLVSALTFSQSSRYDHYSDFGSAFSPRFALRYAPTEQFTAYASYSRGFRAPTLAETSQKNSSGVQTAADPYSPTEPGVQENYPVLVGGNPSLRPERTQNYNLGFAVTPDAQTTFGLDYYRIHIQDVIGTGNIQTIIDANNPAVVVRNPNGTIAYVNFDYQNLNALMTQGFELNLRKGVATAAGTVTLSSDWTYVWQFNQTSGGMTVDFAGNDGAIDTPYGASFPRWRGLTNLGWALAGFDTVLSYQYTSAYNLTQESGQVASYGQFNLSLTYAGFKNWSVYGIVNNLFDRAPPYDPLWLEFPTATPYDPSLYDDQGRYVEVGASFRFH